MEVAVRKDAFIYGSLIAYISITSIFAYIYGLSDRYSVFVYPALAMQALFVFVFLFFSIYVSNIMLRTRPQYLFRYLGNDIKIILTEPVFFRGILSFPLFVLFFSAVSSFKTLIPAFAPFSWDQTWAQLDLAVHTGAVPWEILQPLLGYPFVTLLLNIVYNLWFFIMLAVLFWYLLFSKNEQLRKRFLVSFIFCWIINSSILALVFSSAGPAFYGLLYPEYSDPYAGLMEYLQLVNGHYSIWALDVQDTLWQLYKADEMGVGAGISAMPSMHVSIAWLLCLLSWQRGRIFAILGSLFLVCIFLGSVHLAWHYAVDGYLSIFTTTIIWRLSACLQTTSTQVKGVQVYPKPL